MSVTDYNTSPALNVALFPEGMPRRDVNDRMRVVQSDMRALINALPFFDIGTGDGVATYAFVSATSFSVQNVDVTPFYTPGRRVRIVGGSIGTAFGSVDSAVFSSPNTIVTVTMDNAVALINEALSVSLSIVDPSGLPATSTAPTLTLVSTDDGAAAFPIIEMFRDSATPADDDEIGKLAFTGRDSSATKVTYAELAAIIKDATDGTEDSGLELRLFRDGAFRSLVNFEFGKIVVTRDADNAVGGPVLDLFRQSSTPADNDEIGFIDLSGKNSADSKEVFARIQGKIGDASSSTEDGEISVSLMDNGTLTEKLAWSGSLADFKNPLRCEGDGGLIPLTVEMTNATGSLVRFNRNGATVGSITVTSGGVVSYNTFTGSHWSEFGDLEEADPPEGTLLSTVEAWHDQNRGLPKVEVTKKTGCKRIYGVFGGRDPSDNQISVFSLGTAPRVRCIGPVEAGDLLTASSTPGVAERQTDDLIRSSTLGKVLATDIRSGERLVAANIMAG